MSAGRGRFEVYRDFAGRYRWRLWDANRQVAADSARSYRTVQAALAAADRARLEAMLARPGVDTDRGASHGS